MNHYEILELAQNCHQSEIKKAYRKLVKKFHPDINPHPSSVDRMIKINEAYEVLSDVGTRDLYDQFLAGVPVKTVIQEATPAQKYRAEYLRNKIRKKREQMEYEVKVKQKFYRYFRYVNIIIFIVGLVLTIDYHYQPDQQVVKLKFIGKGRHGSNIVTETGNRYAVTKDLYYEYLSSKRESVVVSYSSILKHPARIKANGKYRSHVINNSLYSFRNVFSVFILLFSVSVVLYKKYSDFRLSCGLIAVVAALYILLFISA